MGGIPDTLQVSAAVLPFSTTLVFGASVIRGNPSGASPSVIERKEMKMKCVISLVKWKA
jgi:hypothetical protein